MAEVQHEFEGQSAGATTLAEPAQDDGTPAIPSTERTTRDSKLVDIVARDQQGNEVVVKLTRRELLGAVGGVLLAESSIWAPASDDIRWQGSTFAPTPIERLEEAHDRLVQIDNLHGSGKALPETYRQLAFIEGLERRTTGLDRRTLAHLKAKFAEFAAWLNQDIGDYETAVRWAEQSIGLATAVGDSRLVAFGHARRSQLHADMGDGVSARAAADAAVAHSGGAAWSEAVAHTYGAHGCALLGVRDDARRRYAMARRRLADAADDGSTDWGPWFDEHYIAAQEAHSSFVLGDAAAAAQGFAKALVHIPYSFTRDRVVYTARSAHASAVLGNLDGALAEGRSALAASQVVESGRIRKELGVLQDWFEHHRPPGIDTFMHELAQANLQGA